MIEWLSFLTSPEEIIDRNEREREKEEEYQLVVVASVDIS